MASHYVLSRKPVRGYQLSRSERVDDACLGMLESRRGQRIQRL